MQPDRYSAAASTGAVVVFVDMSKQDCRRSLVPIRTSVFCSVLQGFQLLPMAQVTEVNVPLIGAIDQGTSSTRFVLFRSDTFLPVASAYHETKLVLPKSDWYEIDAHQILHDALECIETACAKVANPDLRAIGITNQRETIVLWDKETGKAFYNAIVWCDNRTEERAEHLNRSLPGSVKRKVTRKSGLPIHPYFSALKIRWLLENVRGVAEAVQQERCLAGTIDCWLIWNLTGGPRNGVHATDVTNASRTLLMNLHTLKWDSYLLNLFDIPVHILPEIKSCSELYGHVKLDIAAKGIPIYGCLGDQQAALVGQQCYKPGDVKCTYGTGGFILCNTGEVPVSSRHGLLTTVAYQVGPNNPPCYALEGSVAVAGGLMRWLQDNLGVIKSVDEIEELASSVPNTAGVYIVPAFAGLYAPYWDPSARGIICGLTQAATKAHLVRASLESVCFQTYDIMIAMQVDYPKAHLKRLRVDGKMVKDNLFLQLQSDIAFTTVVRSKLVEGTALGAALMAASGADLYNFKKSDLAELWNKHNEHFEPKIKSEERDKRLHLWKKAVEKAMGWIDESKVEVSDLIMNNLFSPCLIGIAAGISAICFLHFGSRKCR
ncbi:hypothetical protein M513_07087 [Trichuris suis]|nr:hypothetical protein M513_07087 [Trichuris suis]